MDRLTKAGHFLVVRMTFTFEEFDRLYILEIVQLYGMSVSIISDRDPRFTAQFWRSFQRAIGDTDEDEHSVSSVDGRTIKEDYPGFGGHAVNIRPGLQGWLG